MNRVSDELLAAYCSDPTDKTGEWPGEVGTQVAAATAAYREREGA